MSDASAAGNKDLLWENISQLPYFRGMLRAVEARFYQDIPLIEPVLDLGCGDGHFARTTFSKKVNFGLDPWLNPLKEANRQRCYEICLQAAGGGLPFGNNRFQTVISNSVLEHIPDLDPVIAEVARVLKPGGKFIFCVPNHRFLDSLSVSGSLDKLRIKFGASAYRRFFNRISRHHHCDDPITWKTRLEKGGLKIDRQWHYFSKRSFHILEWGHYFGLPSLVWKKLINRWILVPERWNLTLTEKITERAFLEGERPADGVYSFYICSKG